MSTSIQIQRLYDALQPEGSGEFRVFVDRLWPRGVAKSDFLFDLWCKDLAPSTEVRQWFGHKEQNWTGFSEKYQSELRSEEGQALMRDVLEQAGPRKLVLLYGARNRERNHAAIIAREMTCPLYARLNRLARRYMG